MAEPERTTDENGREILKYPSGMVRDAKTGKIITNVLTPERAREIAVNGWQVVREKTREEILRTTNEKLKAGGKPSVTDGAEAYSVGVGKVWERTVLNDKAYPRDQIDALTTIGKIADFVPRENSVTLVQNNLIDPETAKEIIRFVREVSQELEIVDAEAKDIPDGQPKA